MNGTDEAKHRHLGGDREDQLAEYRAGRMSEEERHAFDREILADAALADALYGDVNLAVAIEEVGSSAQRRVVAVPRWWQRRSVRIVVPLAAAAVALLVLLPPARDPGTPPGEETFRGAESIARILRPVGDLDEVPSRFVWTRDPDAAMYRLELYDTTARLLYRSTTSDTTVVLPEGALSEDGFEEGYWKVIPMSDAGVERPGPPPASIRLRRDRE